VDDERRADSTETWRAAPAIVPFRYGNRSIKAITEMMFATPGLPMPPLPA